MSAVALVLAAATSLLASAPAGADGSASALTVAVSGDLLIHRWRLARVRYVPTWVRHPDFTVLPVGLALRRRLAPARELRGSYRRTVGVVGRSRRVVPVPSRLP